MQPAAFARDQEHDVIATQEVREPADGPSGADVEPGNPLGSAVGEAFANGAAEHGP